MSADARNSIYLWAGSLAFFGLFWAGLHFNVFRGVSDTLLWPMIGIMTVINLVQSTWGFWKRRESNPDNPNHH